VTRHSTGDSAVRGQPWEVVRLEDDAKRSQLRNDGIDVVDLGRELRVFPRSASGRVEERKLAAGELVRRPPGRSSVGSRRRDPEGSRRWGASRRRLGRLAPAQRFQQHAFESLQFVHRRDLTARLGPPNSWRRHGMQHLE
jgi:hypothetical protein